MVATTVLFLAVPASAASAQYPPVGPSFTASSSTVAAGGSVTLTASGYSPGAVVTFTLHASTHPLGSATAGPDGTATLHATVPASLPPGTYLVSATSPGVPTQYLHITVTAKGAAAPVATGPKSAAGAVLPRTGSDMTPTLVRGAAVSLAAGGLLLMAARRRRMNATAPATS